MIKARNLQNSLLVLLSVVLCLFALEIYLRIIDYNPLGELISDPARSTLLRPSKMAERIYEATPGASGFGWGAEISINSLGFRGREYNQEKSSNTYRIVVLGDSIAFGYSLALENTFPDQLEQLFVNALPAHRVDVINLSLGGYDTLQEVATLEAIGIALDPDMVVLSGCINDIGTSSANLKYIERLQTYGSPIYYLRTVQFIRILLDRFYLKKEMEQTNNKETFLNKYRDYIATIIHDDYAVSMMQELKTKTKEHAQYYRMVDYYADSDYLGRFRYSFEWLQKLQNQHGFRTMFFMVPYLHEEADGSADLYRIIYDIVEHEARRVGFDWLDLYKPIKRLGFTKVLLNAQDSIHLNTKGHKLIAEQLFGVILPIVEEHFNNNS